MSWTTLYIGGTADFREEVLRKLENSRVDFMPGYMEGNYGRQVCELYWIDENLSLRNFKEAIGGKLIWKYRLRFYTKLEEATGNSDKSDLNFTPEEKSMLEAMRKSA
jgi:hypothetical protein